MPPGPPSTPRPKTKRVSAQHTRERVRNNQRRHRARRKDYIATLEEKLGKAEQTISSLRDQIEALQAALTRYRRYQNDQNRADSYQPSNVVSDTDDLGAGKMPAPASTDPLASDGQPGSEVNALIFPPAESLQAVISIAQSSEPVTGPLLAIGSASTSSPRSAPELTSTAASYQAVAEAGSLLPETVIPDQISAPTTPCCSSDPSSGAQLTADTINRMALVPSQETPLLMPALLEPAMEAYYQEKAYSESTMLCSEAYILIAQQNFKGMSQGDVATWLWNGFRRSLQPGEGCRVNTDMLFSLLAFISDT
ncbi:Trappc4 protein [Fusarium solani]|uniref:Trappc4 protein n=1 Tax=Fusarium solani TaxID=169388 RepID=A0A9P9K8L6_FUSSL|nr:Trappc4 protein [Fusarium solani]KAH7243974.1 Trappc4 protein [Fusarium solani]